MASAEEAERALQSLRAELAALARPSYADAPPPTSLAPPSAPPVPAADSASMALQDLVARKEEHASNLRSIERMYYESFGGDSSGPPEQRPPLSSYPGEPGPSATGQAAAASLLGPRPDFSRPLLPDSGAAVRLSLAMRKLS